MGFQLGFAIALLLALAEDRPSCLTHQARRGGSRSGGATPAITHGSRHDNSPLDEHQINAHRGGSQTKIAHADVRSGPLARTLAQRHREGKSLARSAWASRHLLAWRLAEDRSPGGSLRMLAWRLASKKLGCALAQSADVMQSLCPMGCQLRSKRPPALGRAYARVGSVGRFARSVERSGEACSMFPLCALRA